VQSGRRGRRLPRRPAGGGGRVGLDTIFKMAPRSRACTIRTLRLHKQASSAARNLSLTHSTHMASAEEPVELQIEEIDDADDQRLALIGQHMSALDELTVQANATASYLDLSDNRIEFVSSACAPFVCLSAVRTFLCLFNDVFGYRSPCPMVFRSGRLFDGFPALRTLVLDKNFLDEFPADFPVLPTVETLWINNNAFADLSSLAEQLLRLFPRLSNLSMLKNPACPDVYTDPTATDAHRRYRLFVVFKLPQLRTLDASAVSAEERAEAERTGRFLQVWAMLHSASESRAKRRWPGSSFIVATAHFLQ
jgi:hypothetical protein